MECQETLQIQCDFSGYLQTPHDIVKQIILDNYLAVKNHYRLHVVIENVVKEHLGNY